MLVKAAQIAGLVSTISLAAMLPLFAAQTLRKVATGGEVGATGAWLAIVAGQLLLVCSSQVWHQRPSDPPHGVTLAGTILLLIGALMLMRRLTHHAVGESGWLSLLVLGLVAWWTGAGNAVLLALI